MDSRFSGDIIFLVFLVLLLFGPRKLPEIVKVVGRVAVEFKRAANEFRGQFSREIGKLTPSQPPKNLGSLAPGLSKDLEGSERLNELLAEPQQFLAGGFVSSLLLPVGTGCLPEAPFERAREA
jgi:Sec-independent protein translocase protein TatA